MDDTMNKRPSLQFYPGDWWRANDIKGCSMSTQGVWFNILMAMWDSPEQGKIETNLSSLCRIIGAKTREVNLFFSENKQQHFADVTECNGIVTVINRRMYADFLERNRTKERVKQHRLRQCNADVTDEMKQDCNANVTPPSSTSTSTSLHIYTIEQCKDVGLLAGLTEQDAEEYFNHFNSQGWVKSNNRPITNLQSHMAVWRVNKPQFQNDNKPTKSISEMHDEYIRERDK